MPKALYMKVLAATGLILILAGGCEVTSRTLPPGLDGAIVSRNEPARAWRILVGEEPLGIVVLYSAPGDEGLAEPHYYSVRNGWHQELGTIDALGRAYRHMPHEREALWVGTGTLLEGARAVLDTGPETALLEIPVGELRAAGTAAK